MSFEDTVQTAIFERLASDASITSAVVGVYDDIPAFDDKKINFPFITIGDDTLVNWDTDTELGIDATVTINTWSRVKGRKEIKVLQGLIYSALHRSDFNVEGYKFISCEHLQSQSFIDSDGLTRHGVQTFQLLIEKL